MHRALGALVILVVLLLTTGSGSAVRAGEPDLPDSSGEITWSAFVNGHDVESSDANDPARLFPRAGAELMVNVQNDTDRDLHIRTVDLDGQVLGLTFFRYSTRVDLRVRPGMTGSRTFSLDLDDLGKQATGLIPARLALVGSEREALAERPLTVDVEGTLTSVYGVFGLVVAAATAVSTAFLLFRLATSRLPINRWRRATLFGAVGVGLGLTATFTLSALSLRAPEATTWVTLVVVCTVGALALGYLSPTPSRSDDDELDDDEFGRRETDDLSEDIDERETDDLSADESVPGGQKPYEDPEPGRGRATAPGAPPHVIDLRDPVPPQAPPGARRPRETIRHVPPPPPGPR